MEGLLPVLVASFLMGVVSKVKHDGWQELTIEFIYNGQYHQCKLVE